MKLSIKLKSKSHAIVVVSLLFFCVIMAIGCLFNRQYFAITPMMFAFTNVVYKYW